jgi:hypothetical protein
LKIPELARILVSYTHHRLVQRGHIRDGFFAESGDYRHHLEPLFAWKRALLAKRQANCLMARYVRFIVEPGEIVRLAEPPAQRRREVGKLA